MSGEIPQSTQAVQKCRGNDQAVSQLIRSLVSRSSLHHNLKC